MPAFVFILLCIHSSHIRRERSGGRCTWLRALGWNDDLYSASHTFNIDNNISSLVLTLSGEFNISRVLESRLLPLRQPECSLHRFIFLPVVDILVSEWWRCAL